MYLITVMMFTVACAKNDSSDDRISEDTANPTPQIDNPTPPSDGTASISKVSVSGDESNYIFSVEVKSPDLGCNQYADWWEVISEEETLIYRRILAHSHVNEQPFTRSGGAVGITKDQIVYVRVHMNNKGYGKLVYKGSVAGGFNQETLEVSFASELETTEPLPTGCAF